ncbi:MAG: PD-(D/E)XK nuclease superfamily protein [Candidatus Poribacteria bacterium]
MPSRDTTTGSSYEAIIEMCIKRSCMKNDLDAVRQANIGTKPGGGRHRVDWEIIDKKDSGKRGLVSCKYQGTSGTAEEKIAYEVIKLLYAMKTDPRYKKSWIIMGGEGWSTGMREFVNNHLTDWIPAMKSKVTILTTDQLINADLNLN